ncbi:hypothetical protein C1G86_1267 [Dehalococcoides mccartyi]|uniref:Uncharacterized protein n=1 Tax=Dehalococcoides mccartyi TaxID=61435 RepID=A0A328ENY5_9CHLR|nr:hypothetical protein [Dehalococcoides mccartyi]RAL69227.1 hypothetical protein C1G87_1228 [Dehalococcoides mccartyi]RAL70355.1 hypothetical protein C1G86_1267 [Dehalococcoides mccartyi]
MGFIDYTETMKRNTSCFGFVVIRGYKKSRLGSLFFTHSGEAGQISGGLLPEC